MQTAEAECFRILERELSGLQFRRRAPRTPAHQSRHPEPSELFAAALHQDARRPQGLSPEETYAGRSNLLYVVPGARAARCGPIRGAQRPRGCRRALFPAAGQRRNRVHGRGACDDKGPAVSIVAALKVLSEVMADAGLKWNRNVVAMLVVEEETGGNGSLSLAIDRDLKKLYDSIMVCECTGLKFHPANRGAVWYRADLQTPARRLALRDVRLRQRGDGEGGRGHSRREPARALSPTAGPDLPRHHRPLRRASQPDLRRSQFHHPVRPPARRAQPKLLVRDCLEAGLAGYIGLYGDKTKVTDPATGKPMVARHYDLRREGKGFRSDCARRDRPHGRHPRTRRRHHQDGPPGPQPGRFQGTAGSQRWRSLGAASHLGGQAIAGATPLVLEGGQGFVPTHDINEVMERLRAGRPARRRRTICAGSAGRSAARTS